ncbi:hypothetical protein BHYA_0012g00550 [Botrytis hyacinthi]|uniref:Uncharacterized protein n=1 Tax=Botrytis hyacinthi TaxID=278943 RepID=A0A4Z1H1K6_9HELO|nr:hypothetical protein BHYA_0012g00550 [Botrytis hyacinthi]
MPSGLLKCSICIYKVAHGEPLLYRAQVEERKKSCLTLSSYIIEMAFGRPVRGQFGCRSVAEVIAN